MKKIIILLLVLTMAVFVAACGGNGDVNIDNNDINVNVNDIDEDNEANNETYSTTDGTWAHGAETIVFDGENFTISGGEGHRHLPNGTGTFSVANGYAEFTYTDGNVVTIGFSYDGEIIRISGHAYSRR